MKQRDQCVESWWAVKVGGWPDNEPYFACQKDMKSPALFATKREASEWIRLHTHGGGVKPVRVVIATLGETQRS